MSIPVLENPDGFLRKSSIDAGPAATPTGFEQKHFAKHSNTDITKKHRVPQQAELVSKAADPSFGNEDHTPNLSKAEADQLLRGFTPDTRETTKRRSTPAPPGEQALYADQASAPQEEDLDQTPPRGFLAGSPEGATKRQPTPPTPGSASLRDTKSQDDFAEEAAPASTSGIEPLVSSSGPLLPDIDLVLPDELQTPDDSPSNPPPTVGEELSKPALAPPHDEEDDEKSDEDVEE